MTRSTDIEPVRWQDWRLVLLDQRLLPAREEYLEIKTVEQAARAIFDLVVRGAPAIGVTAAYAVVLAARNRLESSAANWRELLEQDLDGLARARPTAVNLAWAVESMRGVIDRTDPEALVPALLEKAVQIHTEDIDANHRMGELGAAEMAPGSGVLTHCNAGALATAGYGTALGVIRSGWNAGKISQVFADETRPWLQGARLTAWELSRSAIPVTVITDSAAATVMREGRVQWVVVGADRVTANGDVINKIGTYSLAVLARAHGVRFMVVAPTSTIDPATATGDNVAIESRDPGEIWSSTGAAEVPPGVTVQNRVFDVTPAEWVDMIVTEKGVLRAPFGPAIAGLKKA